MGGSDPLESVLASRAVAFRMRVLSETTSDIRGRFRQPSPFSFPQQEVPVDPSKGIDKSQKRELCQNKVDAEVSHCIGVFEF